MGNVNDKKGLKHHSSVSILDNVLEEVDELVELKPKGYRYETRAGLITDAINHHIRRIRQSITIGQFPDEFFDFYNVSKKK